MNRILLIVVAAVWALGVGSCAAAGGWEEMDDIDELRERFNRDQGSPRVVLLLSPT